MRFKTILISATAFTALSACGDSEAEANTNQAAGTNSQAAKLAAADNASVLTLSGKVVATTPTTFQLDTGDETVTVEMDDWDWFKEGRQLKAGDQVSVTGRVDQDLWESKKIEASSVYVRNLGVRFYASGTDEEDLSMAIVQVDNDVGAQGVVTAVEGQEFTIGALSGPVRVDASQAAARPTVKVGDRVYAWGDLDFDPRERVELMADGLVVLTADATKRAGS